MGGGADPAGSQRGPSGVSRRHLSHAGRVALPDAVWLDQLRETAVDEARGAVLYGESVRLENVSYGPLIL